MDALVVCAAFIFVFLLLSLVYQWRSAPTPPSETGNSNEKEVDKKALKNKAGGVRQRQPPAPVVAVPTPKSTPPTPKPAPTAQKSAPVIQPKVAPKLVHPLQKLVLKGHTDDIFGIAWSNGLIASVSSDRTLRIWLTRTFSDTSVRYIRHNVEYDHATAVGLSADASHVVIALAESKNLALLTIDRKSDGSVALTDSISFESDHKQSIHSVAIASGKFIMSASADTIVNIWSLKGTLIEKLNTNQIVNYSARISPNLRFLAVCGFASEVKLWELVTNNSSGSVEKVVKAMTLKGHRSAILGFGFSSDSKKMVTASKDGTWRIWNIDVRYKLDEDPRCLLQASLDGMVPVAAALSPNAALVALAGAHRLKVINVASQAVVMDVDTPHQGNLHGIVWSPESDMLASFGTDKHIKIWGPLS